VKLNEFKKPVVNEIDSRSLFGDYGSAALRTGLGSLAGKNVLSTTDQMAKDDYITKFTSRALSGLQSAINSGLVDPNAAGQGVTTTPQTTTTTTQGELPSAADAIAQKRIAAQKAQADAIREPGADEGPKYNIDPNKQMSPYSKLPAKAPVTPKTPEQIRQEKLAAASQAAQGQMNPLSKLPADQFDKSAGNVRKQKQGKATTTAQDQMNPMSKLPADQFNKTATRTRKTQQGQATTTAQGQMNPMSKLPTDQFNKSATNVRRQKQGVATQTAQDKMSAPQKTIKPDNTITMPKRNRKPKGKAAESTQFYKLNYIFESILAEQDPTQGTTKQSISQYITNFFKQFMTNVPNINNSTVKNQVDALAKELEQNYAKDKGRTTLPKLANLAYSVSYANAGEEEKTPVQSPATNTASTATTAATNTTPNTQAATKQAKITSTTITQMMKDFSPGQKKIVLQALQKELNNDLAKKQPNTPVKKEPTITVGKQKRSAKVVDPADAQLLATAKKQGKI
jgi:hypothetical protein